MLVISAISVSAQNDQPDKQYFDQTVELYTLYQQFLQAVDSQDIDSSDRIVESIRSYFSGLTQREQEGVINNVLLDVISAAEMEEKEEFLFRSKRALVIIPQDDPSRFDILSSMADVYIGRGDQNSLNTTLESMRQMECSGQSDNARILDSLQCKANAMSNFTKDLDGHWITNLHFIEGKEEGRPFLVIDISENNGAKQALITNIGKIVPSLSKPNSPVRWSDSFKYNAADESFSILFQNNAVKRGNATMAKSLYDSAQSTRAQFNALSKDERATVGQSAAISAVGGIMGGLYEALGKRLSTSYMFDEEIYISGNRITEDILNVNVKRTIQKVENYNMSHMVKKYDDDCMLWRWKSEYNVVFGMPNCDPVSPYVTSLTKDMELYRIKESTSFWRFKYGGISLMAIGVGAAIMYYGITKYPKDNEKALMQKYGLTKSAAKKRYDKEALKSIIITTAGLVLSISVPIELHHARKDKRVKDLAKYNNKQYKILNEFVNTPLNRDKIETFEAMKAMKAAKNKE